MTTTYSGRDRVPASHRATRTRRAPGPHHPLCRAIALLLLGLLAGCQARDSRLEVTSLRDPYFPETYTLALDDCHYHVDGGGDILVGAVTHQGLGDGQMPVEQVLTLRVYWRPRPGKTHDDPSTSDALIDYGIYTENGMVRYEGTAFAYVNRPDASGRRRVDLENARLKIRDTHGQAPDVLGGARLRGVLYAEADSNAALSLSRRLHRTQPATDSAGPRE